ncbi:dihydrofolate reductase family protein, partial [Escherichia coli]|nr:dihydrofolate reductase family protein [Escherichia coli]
SKTVIDDNASLNVRWDDLPTSVQAQYLREELRQPVRVILDRQNHLTDALKLFHTDGERVIVSPDGECIPQLDSADQIDLSTTLKRISD